MNKSLDKNSDESMSYGSDEVNEVEDKGSDSLVSPKKMTSQDLCNLAKER